MPQDPEDTADVRAKMPDPGKEVVGNSPREFAAAIESEIPKWSRTVTVCVSLRSRSPRRFMAHNSRWRTLLFIGAGFSIDHGSG